MTLYPLFLNLKDRDVLLVGAGAVAAHKIKALLASEARIHVVSPAATPEIQTLAAAGRIQWSVRGYESADLNGVFLTIAATDDPVLQERIAQECRSRKILVNCANAPRQSDFYNAAVVQRGDIQIAISTGGAAPALAKLLGQRIEGMLGSADGALLGFMRDQRKRRPEENDPC